MANLSEAIQCVNSDTRPPILDRTDFASWKQRIRLYCKGKKDGVNILKSIDVEPIPPCNRNNREVHLDYLKHLKESVETLHEIVKEAKVKRPLDRSLASACLYTKYSQELLEYVIGTCPKDFNKRDKKHASTPLTRKKQVTFEDQCETSNNNTHKHVEQLNIQKTNVPVIPSTGVNSCTDASGSKPRSNTKKNRISPAKSVNKKKVEEHPRTNKSSLKNTNHVDSSISSKRTVINLNSHSVCKTCNKCLISANHDMCVVNYLHSVNASPSVKNVVRKVKKVWKPKQVKQVWKATGKVLTNVGYQWKPTGRIFTLGEQCPLTRLTTSNVLPVQQTENVSTSKTVITKKLSNTSQKPLTSYQRRNKQYKAIPTSIPTPTVNQAIDTSMQTDVAYANQQDPTKIRDLTFQTLHLCLFSNAGCTYRPLVFGLRLLKTYDRGSLAAQEFHEKVHKAIRFGIDHFGAIMGYQDYVIGDSVISRHSCYVRDTDGIDLIKGSHGFNLYTISVEDMMKSSLIWLLSKASKNKSWLWHRCLNHLNFVTINNLARKDLVRGLPRLKFEKDHLCSACQLGKSKKHTYTPKTKNTNLEVLNTLHMDLCVPMRVQTINGKKYILVIVDDYARYIHTDNGTGFVNHVLTEYYESVGIFHQKSVPRTPQQNDIIERRNRTLVEAARIMLIFSKALMFLWAEVVATAWLVPNLVPIAPYIPLTNKELEILFQLMFDEYLEPPRVKRPVPPASPVQVPVNLASTPSSTTIDQDAPSTSYSPSSSALQSPSSHQGVTTGSTIIEYNPFAHADNDPFVNVFASEPSSEASSSGEVSSAESTHVTQPHHYLRKWSKDHPLENVIGNPSRLVSTRKQLATDALWCLYNSVLSKVKPKNFKSVVTEDCWFQAMQDEIHEFD
ncbi:retrovirus-related pol polyprotein from transposon TNT 1-94 [Tanacetum coccineum]